MTKLLYLSLIIIFVSIIASLSLYPYLPEKIASHWNIKGEVDSFMPKFWGLFLMPIISIVLFLLFVFLPVVDPLRKNIEKFRMYYDLFIVVMTGFLFYLYLLTIFWALGYRFNMIQFLCPAFAVLFFYIGIMIENTRRNWFIGIRTPWTLSSDAIWKKTHDLGGLLFKVSGLIALLGILFTEYAIYLVIVPAVVSAIVVIVFSYVLYVKRG